MGKFHLRFLNVSVGSSALWHLKLTIYRFFRMEFSWKLFYIWFLYKTLNSHMLAHWPRCCWNCGKIYQRNLDLLSFCPEAITFLSVMFILVYCSMCGKKKHLILNLFNLKIWISMYIFSSLFSVHLLWCWWAEFVKQLRLSYYWTFPLFSYPLCLMKQWYRKE